MKKTKEEILESLTNMHKSKHKPTKKQQAYFEGLIENSKPHKKNCGCRRCNTLYAGIAQW